MQPASAAAIGAAKLTMQAAVVEMLASQQRNAEVIECRAEDAVFEAVPVPAGTAFSLGAMVSTLQALRLFWIWAVSQASSSDSSQPTAFAPTEIGLGKVGS